MRWMMRSTAGRAIVACCVGVACLFITALTIASRSKASDEVLSGIGVFKVGYERGLERAGFSGKAMVIVFTSLEDPELSKISIVLNDPEIKESMQKFVGMMVDILSEPEVEKEFRLKNGFSLIVRSLDGAFMGGLKPGYTIIDLKSMLKGINRFSRNIEKSRAYSMLLKSSELIDNLLNNGKKDNAIKLISYLKEFEGESSQSVVEAEARLNR